MAAPPLHNADKLLQRCVRHTECTVLPAAQDLSVAQLYGGFSVDIVLYLYYLHVTQIIRRGKEGLYYMWMVGGVLMGHDKKEMKVAGRGRCYWGKKQGNC